jgi:S1-C subfamily serine protease
VLVIAAVLTVTAVTTVRDAQIEYNLVAVEQRLTDKVSQLDDLVSKNHSWMHQVNDEVHGILMREPNGDTYQNLQSLSVRVDLGGGCGTGVLFTRRIGDVFRTFVWTAGHVAAVVRNEDGSFRTVTIYQEVRDGGLLKGVIKTEATVIAYSDADEGEDLALLEVQQDDFSFNGVEFTQYDTPEPIGTELIHVGCTLGIYNSVSRGIISQTDRDLLNKKIMFDQTSCIGYPGSSGGGVYLTDGRCIGLLVRGAGPGLNFIVPVRRMRAWAERMDVLWAMDYDVPVPLTRAGNKIEEDEAKQAMPSKVDPRVTEYLPVQNGTY